MKLLDVKVEGSSFEIDLAKVLGVPISRIVGYVSCEFGDETPVFKISRIYLENGKGIWVGGEHDCAYLPVQDDVPNLDEETLLDLYRQQEDE